MGKKRTGDVHGSNDRHSGKENTLERQLPVSSLQQALDYGYDRSDERTVFDYVSILIRHWLVIVALTIVGFGLAFHYNYTAPRIFSSTALVNIGTYVPPVEGPTGDNLREETRRGNYISTQARLLKSYTIAEEVLKTFPDIRAKLDPEFKLDPTIKEVPPSALQSYLGLVSFQPLEGTTLVKVTAHTQDPLFSADVANAHVRAFISLVQVQRKESAYINIEFLKKKLEEATSKVKEAESRKLEYIDKHDLDVIGTKLTDEIFAQRYQGLTSSLNKAVVAKNSAETNYMATKNSMGSGTTAGNAEAQYKLARLQSELREVLKQTKSRFHPDVQNLEAQIKATKDAMRAFGKQKIKEAREEFHAAVAHENRLRNEFTNLHDEQLDISKHKVSIESLQQDADSASEVQKSIAKRLEEAMINAESTQETVVLVDKAYASATPVSPNVSSNIWKGCLLGLLAGVLVAFLLDFVDNKVHSVHDLQQALHVTVLGVVPQFSKEVIQLSANYKDRTQPPEYMDENKRAIMQIDHTSPIPLVSAPFSAESESVRSILATLTAPTGNQNPQTLLITSGQKGDGKTTISLNLATALAQVGEKVLLIDADLRLPSIHKYFDLGRHEAGLLECLVRDADPAQVIHQTDVEHLDLLMPGGPCTNPASLLKSDAMGDLLEMLSSEYDFIIIDSPPIGPVADSLLLARHVDGAAIVVRSGETSRALAESAIVRLRQVGTRIYGVILNDATRGESYWRTGYDSGYTYRYNSQIEA